MELKIHDFQISILRELLFKPNARFRDLKTVDVTNDHFTFHVNRLIQEGLITKSAGKYSLTPLDCAHREFLEETGLTGDFIHKGIVHYHHFHKNGQLLEDKYFWVYKIENTKGKLKEKIPEGENIWMTEKQYRALENVFATFDEMIEVINSPKLIYLDSTRFVESY